MIEFTGPISDILRSFQKESASTVKRSENASAVRKARKGDAAPQPSETSAKVETSPETSTKVEEYSAVINFEYVPSGKIHLNRETRKHIVDFFE